MPGRRDLYFLGGIRSADWLLCEMACLLREQGEGEVAFLALFDTIFTDGLPPGLYVAGAFAPELECGNRVVKAHHPAPSAGKTHKIAPKPVAPEPEAGGNGGRAGPPTRQGARGLAGVLQSHAGIRGRSRCSRRSLDDEIYTFSDDYGSVSLAVDIQIGEYPGPAPDGFRCRAFAHFSATQLCQRIQALEND